MRDKHGRRMVQRITDEVALHFLMAWGALFLLAGVVTMIPR